jgi:hypothetical protein
MNTLRILFATLLAVLFLGGLSAQAKDSKTAPSTQSFNGPDSTPIPGKPGSPGPNNPWPGPNPGDGQDQTVLPSVRLFFYTDKTTSDEFGMEDQASKLKAMYSREIKIEATNIARGSGLGSIFKKRWDVKREELPAYVVKDKHDKRVFASTKVKLSLDELVKVIENKLGIKTKLARTK